jgi:hypothetical protein
VVFETGRFPKRKSASRTSSIFLVNPSLSFTSQIDRAPGEGFHHIAFQVDDLDQEVARWTALGFPFLQGGAWGEKGKPGWGRYAYQDTDAIAGAEVELLWNYR